MFPRPRSPLRNCPSRRQVRFNDGTKADDSWVTADMLSEVPELIVAFNRRHAERAAATTSAGSDDPFSPPTTAVGWHCSCGALGVWASVLRGESLCTACAAAATSGGVSGSGGDLTFTFTADEPEAESPEQSQAAATQSMKDRRRATSRRPLWRDLPPAARAGPQSSPIKLFASSSDTPALNPRDQSACQLFVGNLPKATRWEDVAEVFSACGAVVRGKVQAGKGSAHAIVRMGDARRSALLWLKATPARCGCMADFGMRSVVAVPPPL